MVPTVRYQVHIHFKGSESYKKVTRPGKSQCQARRPDGMDSVFTTAGPGPEEITNTTKHIHSF